MMLLTTSIHYLKLLILFRVTDTMDKSLVHHSTDILRQTFTITPTDDLEEPIKETFSLWIVTC